MCHQILEAWNSVERQTWPLATLEPCYPACKPRALRKTLNLAPCETVELTLYCGSYWSLSYCVFPSSESVGFQSLGRVEPCWNSAGTWWNLAGTWWTLREPRWNLVAWTSGWHILLGTNAGGDFVFLFTLFFALLNVPGCKVGSLAWTLLEPFCNLAGTYMGTTSGFSRDVFSPERLSEGFF